MHLFYVIFGIQIWAGICYQFWYIDHFIALLKISMLIEAKKIYIFSTTLVCIQIALKTVFLLMWPFTMYWLCMKIKHSLQLHRYN